LAQCVYSTIKQYKSFGVIVCQEELPSELKKVFVKFGWDDIGLICFEELYDGSLTEDAKKRFLKNGGVFLIRWDFDAYQNVSSQTLNKTNEQLTNKVIRPSKGSSVQNVKETHDGEPVEDKIIDDFMKVARDPKLADIDPRKSKIKRTGLAFDIFLKFCAYRLQKIFPQMYFEDLEFVAFDGLSTILSLPGYTERAFAESVMKTPWSWGKQSLFTLAESRVRAVEQYIADITVAFKIDSLGHREVQFLKARRENLAPYVHSFDIRAPVSKTKQECVVDAGIRIFPSLEAVDRRLRLIPNERQTYGEGRPFTFGIEGFDENLVHSAGEELVGIKRYSSTLIYGQMLTYKTWVAMSFLRENCKNKVRGCFINLEEPEYTKLSIFKKLRGKANIDGEEASKTFLDIRELFERIRHSLIGSDWKAQIQFVCLHDVRALVERYGADKTRELIKVLKRLFNTYGITSVFVQTGPAREWSHLEYLMDNVISFHYVPDCL